MKIIVCTFLLFFAPQVKSQLIFDWINLQYDPGLLPAHDFRAEQSLHGNPKEILEQIYPYNMMGEPIEMTNKYHYNEKGLLIKIIQNHSQVGEIVKVFQPNILFPILDYSIYIDSLFNYNDTTFVKNLVVWDETTITRKMDNRGNVIYFEKSGIEVFSSFDNFNRKIQDSIPAKSNCMEQLILYDYKKKKILKTEKYYAPEIKISTIYKLDEHFNWIEEVIRIDKSNKRVVRKRLISYN